MESWVQSIPMKRAVEGRDVAALSACLASEDTTFLFGQTINVDGGLILSSPNQALRPWLDSMAQGLLRQPLAVIRSAWPAPRPRNTRFISYKTMH